MEDSSRALIQQARGAGMFGAYYSAVTSLPVP